MAKKKVKVAYGTNGYDRVKQGRQEHVSKYIKEIDSPELSKKTREKIVKGKAKRLTKRKKYPHADPEFNYYFGTSSVKTFPIIDSYNNQDDQLGVCINIFKYNKNLITKLHRLEELEMPIFVDNGSFERFIYFLNYVNDNKKVGKNKKISPEVYFDYDVSKEYFKTTTENYRKLLEKSNNPEKIIITVPEVIGNSELTQKLQLQFINDYKKIEKDFNCEFIVALQFDPTSEDWVGELNKGAKFINKNFPKNWKVGIPFGNDFKIIQNQDNFKEVDKLFDTTLKGYEAHLFACGSPLKIEKFALPHDDFVYSVDASSVMNWSKNSHFFGDGRVIDVRLLKGKRGSVETIEEKRKEVERISGYNWKQWVASKRENPDLALDYEAKFDENAEGLISVYNLGEEDKD